MFPFARESINSARCERRDPARVRLHGTAVSVRARCVVRARCSVPDVSCCVAVRTAASGHSPRRGDTAWLHRSAARLDPRGSGGGAGSVLAAAERCLACTDSGDHAVCTNPGNRGRCTAAVVAFAQTTPRYLDAAEANYGGKCAQFARPRPGLAEGPGPGPGPPPPTPRRLGRGTGPSKGPVRAGGRRSKRPQGR